MQSIAQSDSTSQPTDDPHAVSLAHNNSHMRQGGHILSQRGIDKPKDGMTDNVLSLELDWFRIVKLKSHIPKQSHIQHI